MIFHHILLDLVSDFGKGQKCLYKCVFNPWSPKVEPWVNRWTFSPSSPSPSPSPPSSHHQIFVSLRYRKRRGGGGGRWGPLLCLPCNLVCQNWWNQGLEHSLQDSETCVLTIFTTGDSLKQWLKLEPNEESRTKH